jgi:hypothetical protein
MKKKKGQNKAGQRAKENQNVFVISSYFNAARELIECDNYYEFCTLLDDRSIGVNDIGEVNISKVLCYLIFYLFIYLGSRLGEVACL